MALPELWEIRNDVLQAENEVTRVLNVAGKDSPAYRDALRRFARVWFVLRMTRSKEEFLKEVS